MKLSLCNEVIRELDFAAQCDLAAALGYDGLELAPFTLGDEPQLLSSDRRAELRRAATDAGIEITGLHWLLLTPPGLSITSADPSVRARTLDVMRRLIALCADLGGKVLVHGSPAQRALPQDDPEGARVRGQEAFAAIAGDAEAAGVTYCLEPLSPQETNFITTVAEAAAIVQTVGSRSVRTMIDCRAASLGEREPVAALLDRWLPSGLIAHVHINDSSKRAPGQGEDSFAPVLASLVNHGYTGVVGVEPFIYEPDGPSTAARAAGYLQGVLEGLRYKP